MKRTGTDYKVRSNMQQTLDTKNIVGCIKQVHIIRFDMQQPYMDHCGSRASINRCNDQYKKKK